MMMLRLVCLLVAAMVSTMQMQAQDCPHYKRIMDAAENYWKNGEFEKALNQLSAAREHCPGKGKEIDAKFVAYTKEISRKYEEATLEKLRADRSASANKNAAIALNKSKANYTLGWHLAVLAWQGTLDASTGISAEPGVTGIMNDVISDTTSWFGKPMKGHTDEILHAEFSPDGRYIITAGRDGTARLWDEYGNSMAVLKGHKGPVTSARFSPDGALIVTSSYDRTARLWDKDGKALVTFKGHEASVLNARFSPNGDYVLTAGGDKIACLWALDGTLLRKLEGHEASVLDAVFSPDGENILTADREGTALLWDIRGNLLRNMYGHENGMRSAMFTPDGERIITIGATGKVNIWNKEGDFLKTIHYTQNANELWSCECYKVSFSMDGQQMLAGFGAIFDRYGDWMNDGIQFYYDGYETSTAISPDGNLFVSTATDNLVRIWDKNGSLLHVLEGHTGTVYDAAFSPDGKKIVSIGSDHTALLWYKVGSPKKVLDSNSSIYWAFTFNATPDGSRFVTNDNGNLGAILWDNQGNMLKNLGKGFRTNPAAIFSADGKGFTTVSVVDDRGDYEVIKFWDKNGELIGESDVLPSSDGVLEYAPNGQSVLTKGSELWGSDGRLVNKLKGAAGLGRQAWFFPDSERFLTLSDSMLQLWDKNGNPIKTLQGLATPVRRVEVFPNNERFLTVSDSIIQLWDKNGNFIKILDPINDSGRWRHYKYESVVLSPDGNYVLIKSSDRGWMLFNIAQNRLKLIDSEESPYYSPDGERILFTLIGEWMSHAPTLWTKDGGFIAALEGHTQSITSATFSTDGKYILTSSGDKTARLWDRNGKLVKILEGHTDKIRSAVFSKDGEYILTCSKDRTARIWDKSGNQLYTLKHNSAVYHALFSPDGINIITICEDRDLRIWEDFKTMIKNNWSLSPAELLRAGADMDIRKLLDTSNAETLREIGDYLKYVGYWKQAYDFFKKSHYKRPEVVTLISLFEICQKGGLKFDDAMLNLYNEPADLFKLGRFFKNENKWKVARDLYEKGLSRRQDMWILIDLYKLCEKNKQPIAFKRFLQYDNPVDLSQAAWFFMEQGKWKEAQILYEKVLEKIPDAEAMENLNDICEKEGCKLDFNHFLKIENPEDLVSTVKYFEDREDFEEALLVGEKLLAMQNSADNSILIDTIYNKLSWHQILVGDLDSANETIRRGLALHPENDGLRKNLPHVMLLQGRFEEAKAMYKALASKPFGANTLGDLFLSDFESFSVKLPDPPVERFQKIATLLPNQK